MVFVAVQHDGVDLRAGHLARRGRRIGAVPESLPSARPPRVAVTFSLLPCAISICTGLVGLGLWLAGLMPDVGRLDAALNLGKAFLAGLVATAVPIVWALALTRLRRETPS